AGEGVRVVIADRDEEAGRTLAKEVADSGGRCELAAADLTDDGQVAAVIERAAHAAGGLDILVNNAGGYDGPVFPDADIEHWSATLDLNLRVVMAATHHAVRAMAGRGGAIVNIGSSAGLGLAPHPGPEYAVAKAGVIRLTACLAP